MFVSTSTKILSYFKCDHIVSDGSIPIDGYLDVQSVRGFCTTPSPPTKYPLFPPLPFPATAIATTRAHSSTADLSTTFHLPHQADTDEWWLEKDYSISCEGDTYNRVRVYATAMIFM